MCTINTGIKTHTEAKKVCVVVALIKSFTVITPKTIADGFEILEIPLYIHSHIQYAVKLNTTKIVRKFIQSLQGLNPKLYSVKEVVNNNILF